MIMLILFFFFSSRRRHTRCSRDWSSDVCSSDLHAHRDELVRELATRKIPFVISRLSILDHPLVKDVLAYLRLLARPFDDLSCARVLSAPAWKLQPKDLLRLAERTAKKPGPALNDT